MINALIQNGDKTAVLELPNDMFTLQYDLSQIGIRSQLRDIPIKDDEESEIRVKLFADSDIGNSLAGAYLPYFSKLYQTELPHRVKLVYVYLHDRMDKEKKAWPGIKTIAANLSMYRSTVKRTIKDLEKSALIRKEPHYRENGSATSNRYYLL